MIGFYSKKCRSLPTSLKGYTDVTSIQSYYYMDLIYLHMYCMVYDAISIVSQGSQNVPI
jgi:hypothetical protein